MSALLLVVALPAWAQPPPPPRAPPETPPPASAELLQYLGEFEDGEGKPLDPADLSDTPTHDSEDTPHADSEAPPDRD